MSLRPNAPAFVPPTRKASASSVSSLSAETVETAAVGATAASAGAVKEDAHAEEDGGPSVAATTDDDGGVDDADGVGVVDEKGASSETDELRERVKALEGELESARSKNERLSAAAAQAGRLSAALSNVDEDVKRLTNEVERKTEECEEAWALATEREAERDGVAAERNALAKRCESLKEECKAALKKAIATAEELKELKKQSDAVDEMRASKDEELVAALTARVEELEAAAREAEEERDRRVEEATSSAEARVGALEKALEDAKTSHADEKASLDAGMAALKSELADAKGEAERLRIELDEAVSAPPPPPPEPESTGISEEELEEARSALEEKESQLAATTSALEALGKELEDVKDELRRSSDEKRALGAALNDAEAQVLESRKNVDLIVARAEQASKMFTSNASALRMAEARVATAELEVSVARDEAQAAEEQATSAQDECARLKAANESLERDLADAKLRSSPLRVGASTDVIEALEAERRARALYQSDARYWRERFESVSAASASVMTPSEPKRVVLTPLPPNRTPGTALRLAAGLEKSTSKLTNPPASAERPSMTTTTTTTTTATATAATDIDNNKSTHRTSSIRLDAPDSDDSDDSEDVPISVDRQPFRQPSAKADKSEAPARQLAFTATQARPIAKTHDPIAVTRKLASYFQ